jgi:DNA polymerase-3 subunit alpha
VIEASADEGIWAGQPGLLKDDALVILQAVPRFDRFSGGMRLNVQQVWDLPAARCRFGKYLLAQVALNDSGDGPQLQAVLQQHPPKRQVLDDGDEISRGLPVRLQLTVSGAEGMQPEERLLGQLKLGEASRFYPNDAALSAWTALFPEGKVQVVYEA